MSGGARNPHVFAYTLRFLRSGGHRQSHARYVYEMASDRMKVCFHPRAWEDYLYWQRADRKKLKRINELIRDIRREAFQGVGKPEPLRENWSGFWSRRIDREHRLVYAIKDNMILIAQCRFHYN